MSDITSLYKASIRSLHAGLIIIAVTFVIIFLWCGFAQLDSAVIVPGSVKLREGHREIQHYEGGIIDKVYVQEGDIVKEGYELIKLNQSSAEAGLATNLALLRSHIAIERRILAQIREDDEINFDSPHLDLEDEEVKMAIESQKKIFSAKKTELRSYILGQEREKMRLEQKIQGLREQLLAAREREKINEHMISNINKLFDKHVADREALISAKREQLEGMQAVSSIKSEIEIAKHDIEKVKIATILHTQKYYNDLSTEYEKNHVAYVNVLEKYHNALDVFDRTIIKSPSSGVVTDMRLKTSGTVIKPAEIIMTIIPVGGPIIVECKVQPKDINNVRVGISTKIQLDSYKRRTTPRIEGRIIYVSADKIKDRVDNNSEVYIARIALDEKELSKLGSTPLQPGMPVTAFLIRGRRSVLSYIISPITDALRRALKEQ